MLQDFKGHDSKHFGHEEDEGHYVFLLGIDFFNPLLNKQARKKASVGCYDFEQLSDNCLYLCLVLGKLSSLWDPGGLKVIPWFSHLHEVFCTFMGGKP